MPLVGAAIMPHGALVLDPSRAEMAGTPLGTAARRLHEACVEAGRKIASAKPDVILLYTPHGLIGGDGAAMYVYLNATASGSCEWMGAWAEHRVKVKCDAEAAASLLERLKANGHSAAGMTAFSGYDAPLRWGECVPLSFLGAATHSAEGGARVVVLSHGPVGTDERALLASTPQRCQATDAMGREIGQWAAEQAKRVFLLISGDLAHVHGNERAPTMGDGTADARYLNAKYPDAHPSAAQFEERLVGWVASGSALNGARLDEAMGLVPDAMCCGIEGFRIMHQALLTHVLTHQAPPARPWSTQLLAHEVPVYYGMMVATVLPRDTATDGEEASQPPRKAARTAASDGSGSSAALLPATPRVAHVDFAGKTVLVSGAGHGFGRAIALAFASLGATVLACDGPGGAASAEVAETAALARGAAGAVSASTVDFRDFAAVRAWASAPARVDALVLNAGGVLGHVGGALEEASESAWDAIFDVNAKAAFVAAQAAAPALKRARGRVVTISSGAGLRPSLTRLHAYCAAKHALVGLTKQLALELGPHGITVNSVAPGFVRSNAASEAQWHAFGAEGQAKVLEGTFMRCLGTPGDIADAVLWLASDSASWVTGQVLCVDGGRA